MPCEVSHDAWLRLIAPMFKPDQVVQQSLVDLRPGNVIEQLNEELREWEVHEHEPPTRGSICSINLRPSKRRGVYLADDEHGLLIQDMTPQTITDTVVEFKPKWLVQSPSAPKNAKRCRQCAFTARHNAQRTRTGKPLVKNLCPLDLVSKSQRDRLIAARQILSPPQPTHAALMRMTRWLETNTLLERLRAYQVLLDKKGPLNPDVDGEDFLLAMTLRDCTVFMRFQDIDDPNAKIEARIGDLDLKSKDKKQYWVSTEKALIDEGWYTGTEPHELWQPLTCHLSPRRHGSMGGKRRDSLSWSHTRGFHCVHYKGASVGIRKEGLGGRIQGWEIED